jgi:23S rRNA (guanosine2251-2'-O)-methyltransferase
LLEKGKSLMREYIYGRNPVLETLVARRRDLFFLLVAEGVVEKGRLVDILELARKSKVSIEKVPRSRLEKLGENNQGVALEVSAYPYVGVDDILEHAASTRLPLFVLVLDTIQDPQNLGTLIRTAEAVGVHGVIIPTHRSAEVSPAVVSASSGATEHLLVARANLAQAIVQLKEAGAWMVGLDEHSKPQKLSDLPLAGPLGLVVGGEGEGIRLLVRQSCDFVLSLPMQGKVESLNASVAGSIALYLAYFARNGLVTGQ